LYAELPDPLRPRLLRELLRRDFDVPAMSEELEQFGVFRSLFRPTNVFVDIFDAQNPLGEAILERRQEVHVEVGCAGPRRQKISLSSRPSPIAPGTTKT
jgi:hypothetical protein